MWTKTPAGTNDLPRDIQPEPLLDRREFFSWVRTGLGGAALTTLLGHDGLLRANESNGRPSPLPHETPTAKQVIHICLCGGLSQIDSFDY